MTKRHLTLTAEQRQELETLRSSGELPARLFKRFSAMLALDQGQTLDAVAKLMGVTPTTVRTWRNRYTDDGPSGLHDRPRTGRPIEIDGSQRAQITALACSDPPAGYSAWTLRLLADKAVDLEYCAHISHTQVATILKKRTQASSEEDVVPGSDHTSLPGAYGGAVMALSTTLRSRFPSGLLR